MYNKKPNNFIRIRCHIPFRAEFVYVDILDRDADKCFYKRRIPVKFMEDYERSGSQFIFVRCRIPKRCAPGFEEAMGELKRNILIKGYSDYIKLCNDFQNMAEQSRNEINQNKR